MSTTTVKTGETLVAASDNQRQTLLGIETHLDLFEFESTKSDNQRQTPA